MCADGAAGAAERTPARAAVSALSPLDYIEIQQLVRKYAWALDGGDNYGYAYADLFTPDGVFVGTNQGPTAGPIRAAMCWPRSRADGSAAPTISATSR